MLHVQGVPQPPYLFAALFYEVDMAPGGGRLPLAAASHHGRGYDGGDGSAFVQDRA